jgi:hypothetical protein
MEAAITAARAPELTREQRLLAAADVLAALT